MSQRQRKITVIFERLGPYHVARLSAAAGRCDLLAIEVQRTDEVNRWDEVNEVDFRRSTLYASSKERGGFKDLKMRLYACLERDVQDAVLVNGWSEPSALLALHWCRVNRVPAVVMSESNEHDGPRSMFGEALKRAIVSQYSAGLVGGVGHRDYLRKLGVDTARCFLGYDVVDNDYFHKSTLKVREDSDAIRCRLGLPKDYFLASSRFIEKKNLERLIEAYSLYRHKWKEEGWDLVLLGDGPLKDKLEAKCREHEVSDNVHRLGFKQYQELPAFYALSNAFIHASTSEQWGLVVNEAMACGLPIILSRHCGCARDLVSPDNGWLFDPLSVDEIANCLSLATVASVEERQSMSQASLNRIKNWTPNTFADGLLDAVEAALATKSPVAHGLGTGLVKLIAWIRHKQAFDRISA